MTAGRGIIHSEMPVVTSGQLHGFQLWINLPAKDKVGPGLGCGLGYHGAGCAQAVFATAVLFAAVYRRCASHGTRTCKPTTSRWQRRTARQVRTPAPSSPLAPSLQPASVPLAGSSTQSPREATPAKVRQRPHNLHPSCPPLPAPRSARDGGQQPGRGRAHQAAQPGAAAGCAAGTRRAAGPGEAMHAAGGRGWEGPQPAAMPRCADLLCRACHTCSASP